MLAHTCNNIMNDLSDTDAGLDTDGYARALYAPHPILSGMLRRRQLGLAVIALNLADLAIMVVLALQRGWLVVVFAGNIKKKIVARFAQWEDSHVDF